jgi:signal transduction histidine kinase
VNDLPDVPGLVARVAGPDRVITFASELLQRLLGRGSLRGLRSDEVSDEALAAVLFAPLDAIYLSGAPRMVDEVLARWDKHGDGSLAESYFDLVWRPTRGAGGEVDGVVIHGIEVTRAVLERRAAETSHRHLLDLVQGLRGAIVWEADGRTLDFTFVSPGAERMLGYPPRQWIAQRPNLRLARLHPDDRGWVERAYREEAARGRDHELLYRMLAADDRVVWINDRVYAVRGESGATLTLRGLMTDASTQVRAEQELGQRIAEARDDRARDRLRLHLASSVSGSLELQPTVDRVARAAVPGLADFCFVDAQGATATVHRDPETDALLEGVRPLCDAQTEEQVLHDIPEAMLRSAARDELQLETLKALTPSAAIVQPLIVRGRRLGLIVLVSSGRAFGPREVELSRDLARGAGEAVDNARLYGEARRDAAAREELLSVVSHDLRAPLAAISAGAETIRILETSGERAQRVAAQIHRSAAQMGRLVNDLLEATTIKAGRLQLLPQPERVLALLDEAADIARAGATRLVNIVIDEADPQLLAACDRLRVLRVLGNLLANAVRFAPEDGFVRVSARADGEQVRVFVHNDGEAIPPEHLPHLFERFWRAPDSVLSGHGLGLYIARGIVEAHGGRIEVASGAQGTTFSFTLPKA